jgi:hypothetical protein
LDFGRQKFIFFDPFRLAQIYLIWTIAVMTKVKRWAPARPSTFFTLWNASLVKYLMLFLCAKTLGTTTVSGFQFTTSFVVRAGSRTASFASPTALHMDSEFFTDATETPETVAETPELKDKNEKVFEKGALVRVCVEGVKAFQVPKKGQGTFDADKNFVLGEKFLLLPVGMRGTITKIYNQDEVSANFPVQVKFQPGTNLEEGYDAPVAFMMHMETYEIEVI